MHQRRLTRAGRTHNGSEAPCWDLTVDIIESRDLRVSRSIYFRQTNGSGSDFSVYSRITHENKSTAFRFRRIFRLVARLPIVELLEEAFPSASQNCVESLRCLSDCSLSSSRDFISREGPVCSPKTQ